MQLAVIFILALYIIILALYIFILALYIIMLALYVIILALSHAHMGARKERVFCISGIHLWDFL